MDAGVALEVLAAHPETPEDERGEFGALVLPDRATADALADLFAEDQSDAGTLAARALSVCRSLASSRHVVVLTEALARKYHLPASLDEHSFENWRTAFGLNGLSDFEAGKRLYRAVLTGPGGLAKNAPELTTEEQPPSVARAGARGEAAVLKGLGYTGLAAECSRFNAATVVQAAWELLTATDPRRRDVARIDGTVFTGRVVDVERDGYVDVEIAAPYKAKSGKQLLILSPVRPGDDRQDPKLTLAGVTVGKDGRFIARLGIPKRSAETFPRGRELELFQLPFLPHSTYTPASQWTEDPVPQLRPVWRDVPLTVSQAAGAPSDPEPHTDTENDTDTHEENAA
jgi:hypothetical protein